MKTVLGDELIGWEDFRGNQLLRCPKQKRIEAAYLLQMPNDTVFIDVGSHFGDTVLTMAMYAKTHRPDIKFYACEPNSKKCDYIKKIAFLNKLDITLWNSCIGDKTGFCKPDGTRRESNGACSFKPDPNGKTLMTTLDSLIPRLNNIGFIHIDTEGWESKVLKGATELLSRIKTKVYIVAECWSNKVSIGRGFSATPSQDILDEISNHNPTRLPDICDIERNLFFQIND